MKHRVDDRVTDHFFALNEIIDCIMLLKTDKASADFLKAEHILNGSRKLFIFVQLLFNSMLL